MQVSERERCASVTGTSRCGRVSDALLACFQYRTCRRAVATAPGGARTAIFFWKKCCMHSMFWECLQFYLPPPTMTAAFLKKNMAAVAPPGAVATALRHVRYRKAGVTVRGGKCRASPTANNIFFQKKWRSWRLRAPWRPPYDMYGTRSKPGARPIRVCTGLSRSRTRIVRAH